MIVIVMVTPKTSISQADFSLAANGIKILSFLFEQRHYVITTEKPVGGMTRVARDFFIVVI